jgi:hypothetical protein
LKNAQTKASKDKVIKARLKEKQKQFDDNFKNKAEERKASQAREEENSQKK